MELIINVDDFDLKCMRYLISDPEKWLIDAVAGKVDASKSRMKSHFSSILLADPKVTSMPATEQGLLEKILAYDGYLDRVGRDALIDINGVTIPTN